MLPEMALSGYVFEDARQIAPVLEDPSSGEQASPSLALAVELSVRLACYVLIGLPCKSTSFPCDSYRFSELYSVTEPYDARSESVQRVVPVHDAEAAYNAALLVDAKGEIVHIFRKHFSFLNDKIWATEGPGFETVDLPNIGRVCVAICMDINRTFLWLSQRTSRRRLVTVLAYTCLTIVSIRLSSSVRRFRTGTVLQA